ncbi:MAG: hypothetical protein VR69_16455 [Peptococcaceae bacterium BRH_c4b]|nr:MAG: hypothetical protein VR69_16455 [Peptococcaceae bacterium BRH_c4b]
MDENQEKSGGKLELIATRAFEPYNDMYRIVDFLNKNLKEKRVMFGLTKDKKSGKMSISIYEV